MIESEVEKKISSTKKAQAITDAAFEYILPKVKVGVQEIEIAKKIESFMKNHGSEKLAFDLIVVSGVRGALPHGEPSDKKIEDGDFVTIDMGAVINGYHSDMTRTVAVGSVSERQRSIYDIVLEAQEAAIKKIKNGARTFDIDKCARDIIGNYGYGEYFVHGTGHGVGLEIHEKPHLNKKSQEILESGMIVTVEPGIYIPDDLGVRIEDMLLVTDDGYINLTKSDKKLQVL